MFAHDWAFEESIIAASLIRNSTQTAVTNMKLKRMLENKTHGHLI